MRGEKGHTSHSLDKSIKGVAGRFEGAKKKKLSGDQDEEKRGGDWLHGCYHTHSTTVYWYWYFRALLGQDIKDLLLLLPWNGRNEHERRVFDRTEISCFPPKKISFRIVNLLERKTLLLGLKIFFDWSGIERADIPSSSALYDAHRSPLFIIFWARGINEGRIRRLNNAKLIRG